MQQCQLNNWSRHIARGLQKTRGYLSAHKVAAGGCPVLGPPPPRSSAGPCTPPSPWPLPVPGGCPLHKSHGSFVEAALPHDPPVLRGVSALHRPAAFLSQDYYVTDSPETAVHLDAADGVIDGRCYGAPIYTVCPGWGRADVRAVPWEPLTFIFCPRFLWDCPPPPPHLMHRGMYHQLPSVQCQVLSVDCQLPRGTLVVQW